MKSSSVPWSLQHSAVSDSLKRFISEKVAHAKAMAREDGKAIWPQLQALFAAAESGDLVTVRQIFDELRQPPAPHDRARRTDYCCHGSQWSTAHELWGALEQFDGCGEKYTVAFGQDVIASIPAGSIYFGGTDPGRFVVTALCPSHLNAVPFFTLTQNALVDKGYRQYLRSLYGDRILIPSDEDWTNIQAEYLEDARRRQKENKLLPGEVLEEVDGRLELRSHIVVMTLNAMLSKLLFDNNPTREFYVEESFPLDWMYPHLTPHGLILKINRRPLAELPDEAIQKDRDYWTRYCRPMIGDWLTPETPLTEVAAFVERVQLRHDLIGFDGDARFVQNDPPQRMFSKLRSAIGGVYAWRVMNGKGSAGTEQMRQEADFAFRQAWALCPRSPEAVFRYINLLVVERRLDDAILIAGTAGKLDTENPQLGFLAAELKRMQRVQAGNT